MTKFLFIFLLIFLLQSCRTTQKMKVPLKYPTNVYFSSVCCGTTSPVPIFNFLTEFLRKNKIEKMLILYQPLTIGEGGYFLYFPLNNFSRYQKETFTLNLDSVVKNMKPNNESDGTVEISKRTFNYFNNRIRRSGPWTLKNYDSTMNCVDWFKSTPIAGSPERMKK